MKLSLKLAKLPKSDPADPPARLRRSALFDVDFYLAGLRARGLSAGDEDPAAHYVRAGEAARVAPHPLFDPGYYAERNPDVVEARINLLLHYLDHGWREGRDPHPLVDLKLLKSQLGPEFEGDPLAAYLLSRGPQLKPHRLVDPVHLAEAQRRLAPGDDRAPLMFYLANDPDEVNPSPDFDGYGYRRLHPDSAGMNPLLHYVRFGEAEGRRAPRGRGLGGRVAALVEQAATLDPDILKPFVDLSAVPLMRGYDMARREFRLYRRLAKATGRLAHRHVILTPWLKRGGADKAVVALAQALLENDAEARVLIVCTQSHEVEALDWIGPSQRLSVAKIADEIDAQHDTCVAFCNFLRFAGCRHLYVVNSRFGWDLVENYGATLKRLVRLYGFAFCQDYDDTGRRAGYAWTHLGRAIDNLTAVVSDNGRTFAEFAADHGFDAADAAKLAVLPLPVDERLDGAAEAAPGAETRRPRVLWAGRFSAQKALDVAVAIAWAMPEADICAYGGTEAERAPGNFVVGGPFADFADLPLHEASLFLHTARWEGLPNVLLEAGLAGLPIVARDVGGIGELVDATTGWLLPRDAEPPAFVAAIREALARPKDAKARAAAMRSRIRERHSPTAFANAVRRLTGGAA